MKASSYQKKEEVIMSNSSAAPAIDSVVGYQAATETSRIRFAAFIFTALLVCFVISSLSPWGPTTAYLSFFLALGLIVGYIAFKRDALLGRVFFFTMVAGFLELYSDWYIIVKAPSLRYVQEGPFIASSPFYMPFSWAVVLFLLAVIARWIDRRWGLAAAIFANIALGLTLPVCEYLAVAARWYFYFGVPAIGNVAPFYLLVAEPLIIASLPLSMRVIEKRGLPAAAVAGVGLGVWLYVTLRIGLFFFG
jgi:hypothetical protein